jgi:hypothetical protein
MRSATGEIEDTKTIQSRSNTGPFKGSKARAAALTPDPRREIAAKFASSGCEQKRR